jgi:hypothetical protein
VLVAVRREATTRHRTVVRWQGSSEQGRAVQATSVDRVLWSLEAQIRESCDNGSSWTLRWNVDRHHIVQRGRRVVGRQRPITIRGSGGESVVVAMRADAMLDTSVRGTLSATAVRSTSAGRVTCRSGPLSFVLARE